MGFFSGRMTFSRFRVLGASPGMFGPEHLERLESNAIGKQRVAAADGVDAGWIAGHHILDRRFNLEKNIVNDTLHFAIRIDTTRLPSDLLKAYTEEELQGLTEGNPGGRVGVRQKREARQSAMQRLEEEARDGRYLRRKSVSVLWDALSNELLVGTTSTAVFDRLHVLFEQTFGQGFELLSAGKQAFRLAENRGQQRNVEDAVPSHFVQGQGFKELAWVPDENSRDFLGNEFFLWLWYTLENTDTLKVQDGTEAALMLSRSLVLECPRGSSGRETISSDAPTRLPEARKAIQAGKLPRKVGMLVIRHDQQYEFTLQAETLAVTGAKLPAPESIDDRARLEERVTQVRHLLETLDLVYDVFIEHRNSDEWSRELPRIRKWLQIEESGRRTATA